MASTMSWVSHLLNGKSRPLTLAFQVQLNGNFPGSRSDAPSTARGAEAMVKAIWLALLGRWKRSGKPPL